MASFILNWLAKVLVFLFFAGLVGSAVVVIITFFEDGQLLLEGEETKSSKQPEERKEAVGAPREAF